MKYLIVGIDVSRSSIAACFMLEKPSNPRDDYFDADIKEYRSNLENLNNLRKKIESFSADKIIAICEPTGINYAKLWMNKLADWGIEVRMISNSKLPNYRAELMGKEGKSGAKTDDIDAFAIACWYFDKPICSYLKIRDFLVSQIKQICLRIEHLNRTQSPIINRMRQELAWQCPEIAQVRSIGKTARRFAAPNMLPCTHKLILSQFPSHKDGFKLSKSMNKGRHSGRSLRTITRPTPKSSNQPSSPR